MTKPSHIMKTLILTLLVSTGTCFGQTGWTAPAVVASTAGTSATLLTAPALAESSAGKLALMWHGHWGETTNTGSFVMPIRRHSNIYASFFDNNEGNWSPARQLSHPSVINSQGQVTTGQGDNFLFSWTSGDPISHFRLHTASTSDGENVTTNTWEQDGHTTDPGYYFAKAYVTGQNQILLRDFLIVYPPYFDVSSERRPGISILTEGDTDWRLLFKSDPPSGYGSFVSHEKGNLAVQGPDLMASLVMRYYNAEWHYANRLLISNDYGLSWSSTLLDTPTPGTIVIDPLVASDGNGTWLLFWTSEVSGSPESRQLQVQVSTDTGQTWSAPTAILNTPWGVASAATDANNRWVVTLKGTPGDPVNYLYSDDSGTSWTVLDNPIPGTIIGTTAPQVVYLKNTSRWALVWADQDEIKMTTMTWGESTVTEWNWY